MLVTEEGITSSPVRLEQPRNAYSPILVTLLGISMLVIPEQPRNA